MLKEFAWKTFTDTGGVDSYLFFKDLEDFYREDNKSAKVLEEAGLARDSGVR